MFPLSSAHAKAGHFTFSAKADAVIQQVAQELGYGGDQNLVAQLRAIMSMECQPFAERGTPCGKATEPDGRYSTGIMQVLNTNFAACKKALGYSGTLYQLGEAMLTDHVLSMRCGIFILKRDSTQCKVFGASLCAYNHGAAWCKNEHKESRFDCSWTIKKTGYVNHYAQNACNKMGIDCMTGVVGTNPYTGESNIQVEDTTGMVGPINCPDLQLAQALQQASAVFSSHAVEAGRTVYAQQPITNQTAPQPETKKSEALPSSEPTTQNAALDFSLISKAHAQSITPMAYRMGCIQTVLGYFNVIQQLLNGISAISAAIFALINTLIDRVCEYAAGLINYALSKICLPLPDFDFGLKNWNLKYPGAVSCNGLGGTSLLEVRPSPLLVVPDPFQGGLNNITRGLSGGSRF